jgi:hypothetical protein
MQETDDAGRSGSGAGRGRGKGCIIAMLALFAIAAAIFFTIPWKKFLPGGGRKAHITSAYAGDWQGADSSKISIRDDGAGSFDLGYKRVVGGVTILDEGKMTLEISGLLGVTKTWRINSAPQGDEMTLDGIIYHRTSGFPPGTWGDSSTVANSMTQRETAPLPSEAEQRAMVGRTMMALDEGIRSEDFTALYNSVSTLWSDEISAGDMEDAFEQFTEKHVDLSKVAHLTPEFSPPPAIGYDGLLTLAGSYATTPDPTGFQITYVVEDGTWKLRGIRVYVGSVNGGISR